MADYAIGDIHACLGSLDSLLQTLDFHPQHDRLWLTGDLVGRGPQPVETLRRVRDLGDAARTVLGNHDIHCIAVALGAGRQRASDRLEPLLAAPDRDDLIDWLRHQPLLIDLPESGYTLTHAGIAPQWDSATAARCAAEAEAALQGDNLVGLMNHLYGNKPDRWSESLTGWARLRFIINAFTRMRFCRADGRLDFSCNGPPESAPKGLYPWYATPDRRIDGTTTTVLSGHWSRLGCRQGPGYITLDTGCLWGGQLTAVQLDRSPARFTQLDCPASGASA
ncbi:MULTISPECIES: symmetrical bis(5'-nucleosyl)-tetraphosphatase [Spiribacter]|uniref:symmetrical bis(5'-nucleosyl)-tetraphosphatase n=1 Tax=Spiribacter TaxID=1335745 RepID=UPI00132FCDE5|nr:MULTISPECIES: symmetrical bis(5'-nucleosyl)-tetraphosphatase [Spiribacter]KAF0284464.1 bis(5'-nucleosyl)-tetraphosphatase (symmetrical) [Spiribacter roseus]KAF0286374.1 bis(5'-nucleosyl)-tetraphosphatase (symmetrical) [Spiribacter sp. SSL99]